MEKIRKIAVTIREEVSEWAIEFPGNPAENFLADSAGDALNEVKHCAQQLADNGTSSIMVITWEATTVLGSTVVSVLTGKSR